MNFKTVALVVVVFSLSAVRAFAQSDTKSFYELTAAVPAAFASGNMAEASTLAKTLLANAPNFREDWNYGNAVHVGHLVLGRVALASGDVQEAKRQLLQSAQEFKPATASASSDDRSVVSYQAASKPYKASPQMDTFGPDMRLAKDLLAKGEKNAVVKYLDLCASFWTGESNKTTSWKSMIEIGEMPDFGLNLIYFFKY